ncbi:hypothetical protein CYMTET_7648, partial [Cymbomonas tetramitiformis]
GELDRQEFEQVMMDIGAQREDAVLFYDEIDADGSGSVAFSLLHNKWSWWKASDFAANFALHEMSSFANAAYEGASSSSCAAPLSPPPAPPRFNSRAISASCLFTVA